MTPPRPSQRKMGSVIKCRRPCHQPPAVWRRERQRPMRPESVVVIHECLEDPLTVPLAQHEEPIETLRADRAHKPLGNAVGLWRAKRCPHDLNSVASEDLVKPVGEFQIPITNQKPDRFRTIHQGPRHLPRLLDDPRGTRIAVHQARCTRRLPNSMKKGCRAVAARSSRP
jgi:hypothetical protein